MVHFQFSNDNTIEIARWCIDDGLLTSNSTTSIGHMINDIHGTFDIQDLGEPDCLLGIKITSSCKLSMIHVSQLSFIDTIAKRFDISSGKSITYIPNGPIRQSVHSHQCRWINRCTICVTYWQYELLCSSNLTQHFICHQQVHTIHFKPTLAHWEAAKCIIQYLLHVVKWNLLILLSKKGVITIGSFASNMMDAFRLGNRALKRWISAESGGKTMWEWGWKGCTRWCKGDMPAISGELLLSVGIQTQWGRGGKSRKDWS